MIPDSFVLALLRVKQKTQERWSVAFVISRILSGHALYQRIADCHVVVEMIDRTMNVWILEGKGLEKREVVLEALDNLARKAGAEYWRLTGRKGWERLMKGYMTPVPVVTLERKVP